MRKPLLTVALRCARLLRHQGGLTSGPAVNTDRTTTVNTPGRRLHGEGTPHLTVPRPVVLAMRTTDVVVQKAHNGFASDPFRGFLVRVCWRSVPTLGPKF